jgi:hypothetical protein
MKKYTGDIATKGYCRNTIKIFIADENIIGTITNVKNNKFAVVIPHKGVITKEIIDYVCNECLLKKETDRIRRLDAIISTLRETLYIIDTILVKQHKGTSALYQVRSKLLNNIKQKERAKNNGVYESLSSKSKKLKPSYLNMKH